MGLQPTHRDEKLSSFTSVILSERSESKDPYAAHSPLPGMFFDGATSVAGSRGTPMATSKPATVATRHAHHTVTPWG